MIIITEIFNDKIYLYLPVAFSTRYLKCSPGPGLETSIGQKKSSKR